MADTPYRCQPFPVPLHSRNHCVSEECCCVVFLIIVAMHIPIMTQGNWNPVLLASDLRCEAREAGSFLASIAHSHAADHKKLAYIAGGETVVHLTGKGLGSRNQELGLAAAEGIAGLPNVAIFSVGSDGTDGPTDAAGGYVDGSTKEKLLAQGIAVADVLEQNDAYHALERCDGLIKTGATGTNVNDVAVVLVY